MLLLLCKLEAKRRKSGFMRRQGRQRVRVQGESRHNCIARQQLQKITSAGNHENLGCVLPIAGNANARIRRKTLSHHQYRIANNDC